MRRRLFALFVSLFLLFGESPVEATRVSPMVVDVQPSGRASVGRIEVTNPGGDEFPVEVQMYRGDIGENGELSLTPADDQFLVFPAQAVIPANGQQVFRVQYVGDPDLAASQIYYLSIRQIPVQLEPGPPRVQVVVNFNVLVNVVPDQTSAEPAVDWVRPATRDGANGIEVRLVNRGSRYFAASRADWRISGTRTDGTDGSFTRSRSEMPEIVGVGIVPPGGARIFFIPTESPMAGGTVRVSVEP